MLRHIKSTITIIFGAAIFAFGLTYFVVPHHLFEGGATGITLITYYLFNIPISLMNILINIPLFLLAWKIFGLRSLYSSLLGTIAVSVWLAIFEKIPLQFNLEYQSFDTYQAFPKQIMRCCKEKDFLCRWLGLSNIFIKCSFKYSNQQGKLHQPK